MATVLEECCTEEQLSILRCVLWANGLNVKDIHKEIFPLYGGKCLSCEAVHNWVEEFSQGRSNVADDARTGRPVEIATEGKTYRCWCRICGEVNVFPRFEYHMFYV
jgi:hypothetical protein